jgi:hypothetical protein
VIDRERELIRQYDDAHRAYLESLPAVKAAVFGQPAALDRVARAQITKARHRLAFAEKELQDYWSTQAIAQEVSR